MSLYVLRLRDGNCIVTDARNEEQARENATRLSASEVVSTRKLKSFVAQFALGEEGGFAGTLVDSNTLSDLYRHEYPMLGAANAQSYADFDSSEKDSKTNIVLFDPATRRHSQNWENRDKQIVRYAVEQERLRFAN
jgi:hypothetical protein